MVVHINGVLRDGDYHMSIATDGKSVLWQRGVQAICFTKYIVKSILKDSYSPLSHCTVTYGNVTQEMKVKKVLPENKQFGGAPQVMCIKLECTGTFLIIKRDYEIDYVIVDDKKQRNHQCNSICIIKVKKTKNRAVTEAEVDTGKISLLVPSARAATGAAATLKSGGNIHEVDNDDSEEEDNDEDDEDACGGGGGRQGGRYGGRGGGGKCKRDY